MTTRQRKFQIRIIALEETGGIPAINRLRLWLKAGLRQFGLRCLEATEVREEEPEQDQEEGKATT